MFAGSSSSDSVPEVVPVSVVIPCFNCAATIERAVRSVVFQHWRPKELILVDDCSSDSTINTINGLIGEFGGQIKMSLVVLASNQGPAAARNRGWDLASGDYVAFLDADDCWHPKKIELQYGWMRSNPQAVLAGHGIGSISPLAREEYLSSMLGPGIESRKVSLYKLLLSNIFPTPSVMIRGDVGLRFTENKRFSEDFLLWAQITSVHDSSYFLEEAPLVAAFKALYGDSGASGNLHAMQSGELDTYRALKEEKRINFLVYVFFISFSYLKYFRRLFIVECRRRLKTSGKSK